MRDAGLVEQAWTAASFICSVATQLTCSVVIILLCNVHSGRAICCIGGCTEILYTSEHALFVYILVATI